MKVVYVAGRFRGPDSWAIENNIRRAEEAGFEIDKLGAIALVPHCNTRFFHGSLPDEFWLQGTMELLRRCDAIYLVPGWKDSSGAVAEAAEAEKLGLPVFHSMSAVGEWLRRQTSKENKLARVTLNIYDEDEVNFRLTMKFDPQLSPEQARGEAPITAAQNAACRMLEEFQKQLAQTADIQVAPPIEVA